ncbi:MAG: GpE family phage tail protein [Bryobacterales bacterium]|nr:GpE family phage tail protein [Bryobacterales bacterium]
MLRLGHYRGRGAEARDARLQADQRHAGPFSLAFGDPALLRNVVADLAAVFHWQPSECGALPVREALAYRREAVRRAKALARLRG